MVPSSNFLLRMVCAMVFHVTVHYFTAFLFIIAEVNWFLFLHCTPRNDDGWHTSSSSLLYQIKDLDSPHRRTLLLFYLSQTDGDAMCLPSASFLGLGTVEFPNQVVFCQMEQFHPLRQYASFFLIQDSTTFPSSLLATGAPVIASSLGDPFVGERELLP